MTERHPPGQIRDAIHCVLRGRPFGATIREIQEEIQRMIGPAPESSVRSYLNLNTPGTFTRTGRGQYGLAETLEVLAEAPFPSHRFRRSEIFLGDCFRWLRQHQETSVHAVVSDPPYGLFEYSPEQQEKLRNGKGGVWRIPPSFDGTKRSPLPRFTTLRAADLKRLEEFFDAWAKLLFPVLVPGANVVVASNPLLSHIVSGALVRGGLEVRGAVIRLVMTMRGGDRPKHAHEEFSDVSVMPRSMWEPWLLFRRPLEGRVQDNLRKWRTGGFRRISGEKPFGDVIQSAPTRKREREIAPHPSLKPQAFLRQLVRASLPLGEGVVLDTFAGSGSTLAAADAVGYESLGVEQDPLYFEIAQNAVPRLSSL